jgi:hypothetical protein
MHVKDPAGILTGASVAGFSMAVGGKDGLTSEVASCVAGTGNCAPVSAVGDGKGD